MVEKVKNYVLRGSWEEDLEDADDLLNAFCWITIILAILYFGSGFIRAFMEGTIQ